MYSSAIRRQSERRNVAYPRRSATVVFFGLKSFLLFFYVCVFRLVVFLFPCVSPRAAAASGFVKARSTTQYRPGPPGRTAAFSCVDTRSCINYIPCRHIFFMPRPRLRRGIRGLRPNDLPPARCTCSTASRPKAADRV